MRNISFVIHYRKDCDDRKNNLIAILDYFAGDYSFKDSPFIIINDDASFDDKELLSFKKDNVFIYKMENTGNYNRTLCFNIALYDLCKTEYICFLDTDCIFSKDALLKLQPKLNEIDVLFPYDGLFIDAPFNFYKDNGFDFTKSCTGIFSAFMLSGINRKTIMPGMKVKDFYVMGTESVGGAILWNTEKCRSIGGYNILFTDWGYEDNEIINRAQKHNLKIARPENAPLLHLHHNSKPRAAHKHFCKNRDLYEQTKASQLFELQPLIKYLNNFDYKNKVSYFA